MNQEKVVSESAQKELLQIARQTVESAVRGKRPPRVTSKNPELRQNLGVFVTLTNRGNLRGCIGTFESNKPLYETVTEMAFASATQDSRFFYNPITPKELPQLKIKISILSPRERVQSPDDVVIGKHGIYITRGWQSGCYLPEVATDHKMTKDEFLSSCCEGKAGLPPDAWKDPKTEIYVFTTQSFGEE